MTEFLIVLAVLFVICLPLISMIRRFRSGEEMESGQTWGDQVLGSNSDDAAQTTKPPPGDHASK